MLSTFVLQEGEYLAFLVQAQALPGVGCMPAQTPAGSPALQEEHHEFQAICIVFGNRAWRYALLAPGTTPAGGAALPSGYKVLEPIRHGNLTVFPVVAASSHDTRNLTLDEGLRSGDVIGPSPVACNH